MNFKNNNELLEEMEKRKNILGLNQNIENNDSLFKEEINKEKAQLRKKSKEFYKKLISLYGSHSSKFRKKKEEDSKNAVNSELNSIKEANNEPMNNKELFIKKDKNSKNLNLFRKKMAYYYRFINNSKKNKEMKKYRNQSKTLNKLLQISKSIPDILLQEIKIIQNNNKYFTPNIIYEDEIMSQNNNEIREYGFLSPFKGNRYVGNIYNYYKSNNCLNEDKLIFGKSKSFNNINEKINDKIKSPLNQKEDKLADKNGKIKTKIKKNEKSGMIHLSSLLLY